MRSLRLSLLLCSLLATEALPATPIVHVEAGEFDRRNILVTFDLRPVAQKLAYAKASDGKLLPVQAGPRGKGSFIIPSLIKGGRASFALVSSGGSSGCDVSGLVNGERAGITIFCHPSNFRAPQPMRLHPTEPFFCFAPQQAGDMEIVPGKTYVSRYRFVIHDGAPDKSFLESVWNDYANPPTVTVSVD